MTIKIVRLAFLTIALLAASAAGQDRLETYPEAEAYRAMAARTSELVTGGTVTRVRWSDDGATMTFAQTGKRWRYDLATGALTATPANGDEGGRAGNQRAGRRGPGRGRQYAREESPDEAWVAICDEWNVVIESADSTKRIEVTTDGHRKFRYGSASWVYGEELDQRNAMWWSPDSSTLVFYEFDERDVPEFFLTAGLTELRTELRQEGYPKPGEPNPKASLLVYDVASETTTRLETGDGSWYVYGVRFAPAGDELLYHMTNRHQNHMKLMAADVETGKSRLVVDERQETWQANRPTMRFLEDNERFIWASERTGWKQYELRHLDGRLLNELSSGDAPVRSIVRIDEEAGWLYYTQANGDNPLSDHLNRVRLDGERRRRLTSGPLHHSRFSISPDHTWFVTQREAVDTPPATVLCDMKGEVQSVLAESDTSEMEAAGVSMPELVSFTAADGETVLYGALWKPSNYDAQRAHPLLVDVYGGPLSRGLRNSFRAARAECELGFCIVKLENRGTVDRGKAFEGASYLQLGVVDLDDQVAGVRHLTQRDDIDGDHVGIFGHSYGGYMSALAILRYPDVFHAAVAGAPVTDWRNYDTIYTERFMRTPQENESGYDAGSCLTYADQLDGRLLLMHGMVDDNVHPNNSWQLIDLFQRESRSFDMMMYPNAGHGLGPSSRPLRLEYLYEHLVRPALDSRIGT